MDFLHFYNTKKRVGTGTYVNANSKKALRFIFNNKHKSKQAVGNGILVPFSNQNTFNLL